MSESEAQRAASARRVAGAAGLLAASVVVARLAGFARDALFAKNVGLGPAADAYFAAFLIPDILGYLLASGAASVAFLPPYLKRREQAGPEAASRFASIVIGNVTLASVALTALCWLGAESLVALQFPDFDAATRAETLRLTRILLPGQIFFLTGGCLRAVLMAHDSFRSQALANVIYSVAPIAGGLLMPGTDGFAWGTLAGAAIGQWAIPAFELRALPGAPGRIRIGFLDHDFREYLVLALPLMVGVSLATVDEWYEKWVGAAVAPGAIAAITYARKLMMAPVGIVGQAVGAALLPSLTALHQRGDRAGFDALLTSTLRATLSLGLLAAAALAALAGPSVRVLYERGRFSQADSEAVAALLFVLAWATPGWAVQQVAVRGFYARSEMGRAMAISSVLALLVFPLYLLGGRLEGVVGLARASVAAITLNAIVTLVWLRARTGSPDPLALAEASIRTFSVATPAGLAALAGLHAVAPRSLPALAELALGAAIFAVVALAGTALIGDSALRAVLARLLARITRGRLGRAA